MSDEPDDLSEEADKLLVALAGAGTGDGLISARHDHSNIIVSKGPDVCRTPTGGGMCDVGYSSIAYMDTAIEVSQSVRNNGCYDFQLNSRCFMSEGMEPGTGKGVKADGYKGIAYVRVAADYVYSEGYATVRHRDPAWINYPPIGEEETQKPLTSEVAS